MKESGKIHVGTSGWHYAHWQGVFYPEDLAKKDFLQYYSGYFQTAEINNTFYQVPQKKTLIQWKNTAPQDFLFSVKASRFITHMKKLKDPEQPVSNFLNTIKALEDKLGPILFQLPPRWKINLQRLESFLRALPGDYSYAFEFRDPSWFESDVYDLLREHRASFCIYDFDYRLSPKEVTADFVYIRLHGPDGPYRGKYDKKTLSGWAGAFAAWSKQKKEIYCYFDNDQSGFAVQNALDLKEMVMKE
ncbi:MAG: DUF72 domain-containing protein [Candidatus Aminicenantes bacterium]